MNIGDNAKAALKDVIERLINIEQERSFYKEDISSLKQEMREKGMPVSQLVRQKKQKMKSQEERDDERSTENLARQTIGLPPLEEGDHAVPEEIDTDLANRRLDEIMEMEDYIANLRADEKEIEKEAKETGFSVPALKVIVKNRVYPDKAKKARERNQAVEAYEAALQQ